MHGLVPEMTPAPGDRLQRFVGDRVQFALTAPSAGAGLKGWRALLRTNLGRAQVLRREIIQAHARGLPLAGAGWRDLPMRKDADGWHIDLPLAETGYFKAKAYLLDPKGWQHWPEGPDVGVSVHPDAYRTANTIYCAFPRLFGPTRAATGARDPRLDAQLNALDAQDYTVIPPSGKLRGLVRQLPHIVHALGCRILHLLPVNPTPTTGARFGRFGSPYASLDLTAIDPALVEFDQRTTGVEQFCELTGASHSAGARVFLDIVINHTGWGSKLQENHPEWFVRDAAGAFASPGAWDVTWEDLVELKHDSVALWDEIAEALLTWCRRGVDGFRCDAGYKVPVNAWQYIIARVQDEFPETIFLLEGLGGPWEATQTLLTEGGMHWAYSELFQNYSGRKVADYLDYALRQSQRVGLYVHYSETHDNDRLAARGRAWSLLRNRLCALTSVSGAFGFTCGVEWLATGKISVHGSTGLAWDNHEDLVPELAQLNKLLAEHPCFFDGAKLTRVSPSDSPVYALRRESAEGHDVVLVLVNTEVEKRNSLTLPTSDFKFDLLGQPLPASQASADGKSTVTLEAGACYCLSPATQPRGLSGDAYRRARAQAAWALEALAKFVPSESINGFDWRWLAEQADRSPADFLTATSELGNGDVQTALPDLLQRVRLKEIFPRVIVWSLLDRRRFTPVPPGHWLLVQDSAAFRATLEVQGAERENRDGKLRQHVQSIAVADGHIASFPPRETAAEAGLLVERCAATSQHVAATIRFLAHEPAVSFTNRASRITDLVLLTNGIGGMARIGVDLGRVQSKYDCVLGANLHPSLPVDRHIFVKRLRVWVNADGFLSPLNLENLASFNPGPPAVWHFVANAGDARTLEIEMRAHMLEGRNATVFRFSRPTAERATGKQLPADADVRLTVRFDIEDRNFHWETKRNGGAEYHFATHTRALAGKIGFAFTPGADRHLRVFADSGEYHPQPEWCENIAHPVEQSRGQTASGDAYSPGWFELPLPKGARVTLVVTADPDEAFPLTPALSPRERENRRQVVGESGAAGIFARQSSLSPLPEGEGQGEGKRTEDLFAARLLQAARAFVVRRGEGKTVIAGYPWFLDWGRDSLICARGLLAAGMADEVRQLLLTFARFEKNGTLPNALYGDNASNRDTSDAPLWFALACEEFAALAGTNFYQAEIGEVSRTIAGVLSNIAVSYAKGTPNGVRMDLASASIWSPAHFTWMDTNSPACTPREGYPIEIQVLWIRLLRQLERIDGRTERKGWGELADRALASLGKLYWLEDRGYYADLLIARRGQPAAEAKVDDALRSNCLLAVSLGLVQRDRARRCVEAALRYLVVPGALRSLAPLPVSVPLPIHAPDGRLLNNPAEPYFGRYEGDEDSRRKLAYHNGTAWTWMLPNFCEALARAWDFSPEAVAAARAYLGSVDRLMTEGCLGQIPEIVDGDAPHAQRGCDAQAWGVTETLRVWKLLQDPAGNRPS